MRAEAAFHGDGLPHRATDAGERHPALEADIAGIRGLLRGLRDGLGWINNSG